ncbi:hypothetical protein [Olsenella massiliensis]|uniref:hypothetical protein n=1 Tax=Olsenella massiliensis TaxID=1622075 RepID=UPI00071C236D|nr:hypothetical protein [Olsenella massiliensis]
MDTNANTPGPVIETASATTSPDNANSGSTAYIVAAIVSLLLIGMSVMLAQPVERLVERYVEEYYVPDVHLWDSYEPDPFDGEFEEFDVYGRYDGRHDTYEHGGESWRLDA